MKEPKKAQISSQNSHGPMYIYIIIRSRLIAFFVQSASYLTIPFPSHTIALFFELLAVFVTLPCPLPPRFACPSRPTNIRTSSAFIILYTINHPYCTPYFFVIRDNSNTAPVVGSFLTMETTVRFYETAGVHATRVINFKSAKQLANRA